MKRAILFVWILMGMAVIMTASSESILVISDLHLTEKGEGFAPAIGAVARAAKEYDVLLLLGDNTNNGKPAEHALMAEYLRQIARQSGAEIYVIPGNHDYTASMTPYEFSSQYGDYGWNSAFARDRGTASCAVMTQSGTCLLLLDTNQYDTPTHVLPAGGVTYKTILWASDVLASLPAGTPVIVCGHHPIAPAGRSQQTVRADALLSMLEDRGAPLYLCGHDHGFHTVKSGALRQITVGQPHAYPGWAGAVEVTPEGFSWHVTELYGADDPFYTTLKEAAHSLAVNMARGTLRGTSYEEDEGAVQWFADVFSRSVHSELTPENCAAFLADENCQKWREIETRTVVKEWILGLLENCPESVKEIEIPAP